MCVRRHPRRLPHKSGDVFPPARSSLAKFYFCRIVRDGKEDEYAHNSTGRTAYVSTRSAKRQPKARVISNQGQRATRLVGALRLGSAAAMVGAIAAIGRTLDSGTDAAATTALLFTALAAILAFSEFGVGGRAARAEERRIRRALLTRQFAAGADGTSLRNEFPPGRVIPMFNDGAERITNYKQIYWGSTLAAMMIPLMVLLYIGIAIDPVVGFTTLVLVPIIPLAIGGFMKLFRKTSANSRKQRGALASRYLDAIRNLVTIRLLGAGDRIEAELRTAGERNRGAIMRLLAGNQVVIIVMDGIFSLVLICAVALLVVARHEVMTTGDALSIMLLTVLLLEPLQQVAGFFYIGMGGIAAQREIRSFLAATDQKPPKADAIKQAPAPIPLVASRPDESVAISMDNVSFGYDRNTVLSNVNLRVTRGERVALVGPSGVGKSTLMALLRGTLPPQDGQIFIAGHDADKEHMAETRAASAAVGQTTWLFTGTIADNLRLAQPTATDEQLWDALRQAQVADEIAGMPRGLDTYLGEGAGLISGGQAQRISLAQALLSGRTVLLLDEPTSHVDIESESAIINAIAALPRDRTIVLITHRPSLLKLADTVYTLSDGQLKKEELSRV